VSVVVLVLLGSTFVSNLACLVKFFGDWEHECGSSFSWRARFEREHCSGVYRTVGKRLFTVLVVEWLKPKNAYSHRLVYKGSEGVATDLLEAIRGRRSIRAFRSREVSVEDVARLIDAARWAPSAGNIQPWEFIVVRRSEVKRVLAGAALGQGFIEEASVVIVVCANEHRSSQGYGMRGKSLYCIQDTAAALQNIHLMAYSLGLSTCWVGAFNEDEARRILGIPQGIRPVAMIPVGYAAETPEPPSRRPLSQVVHYETF
jgi:nitroreductase